MTCQKKKEKLHLLEALSKILLDIDKAIKIIRETENESDVVPNLMIGFGIDEVQAEYVAEIKLRNINRSISCAALRKSISSKRTSRKWRISSATRRRSARSSSTSSKM